MVSANAFYNIDNEETREQLQTEGMIIKVGHEAHIQVETNPSTGFEWMIDEKACDGEVLDISTDMGPTKANASGPGNRQHMTGLPMVEYFTLVGQSQGSCTFRIIYARSWEFSFEDETQGRYVRKVEIPVTVIDNNE